MIKRIDKILSDNLNISRKEVKKLLSSGVVKVNNVVCADSFCKYDTEIDEISVEGKRIECRDHIYIMMNKPAGVVSVTEDGRDKTVIDIVPDDLKKKGLFPAGRLDKDTVGFVLITDDGKFAHDILSPKHHVKKTYIAGIEKNLTDEDILKFKQGIVLSGDGECLPAEVKMIGECEAMITICEGRYHQVKRMFAAIGNRVLSLKRTSIGGLQLDNSLESGECRLITAEEIDLIKHIDNN